MRRSEWGFNMRVLGAMLDSKKHPAHEDAGMGGLGFSLRARPNGFVALDFGLDFIGGTDFNGRRRNETPFTINGLFFVNPRDRVQFYVLTGLGWSTASVETTPGLVERYGYFGLQAGMGLEFRVARQVALNTDLLGFVRGRTDRASKEAPEFTDPVTGRSTNASGGGLLRGGVTFYW